MKKILIVLCFISLLGTIVVGQVTLSPTKSNELKIFDTTFVVNTYEVKKGTRKSPITFLVVHNNESTGLNLVKEIIKARGGKLIELVNGGQRNLSFKHNDKTFCVDPNRIYSQPGRGKDLKNRKEACMIPNNDELIEIEREVGKFSENFLDLFLPKKRCSTGQLLERRLCSGELLVAVHNNSKFEDETNNENENLSVKWFINLKGLEDPGRDSDTINSVYLVNKEEVDNFILVSNSFIANKLLTPRSRKKEFNVVVQTESILADDGSMSIFCGLKKINYLIIEAIHDKGKERQREMIRTVFDLFPPR